MGCGFLNNFKFSKNVKKFIPHVLLGPDVYAVTDLNVKRTQMRQYTGRKVEFPAIGKVV